MRDYTIDGLLVIAILMLGTVLLVPASAGADNACPYYRLQVLVPGESPAPGTDGGKTGTPQPQTAGVPFQVLVRACDSSWRLRDNVNHVMQLSSTDSSAELPAPTALCNGEVTLAVTLNSEGDFTVTARDITDYEHIEGVSSLITVRQSGVLGGFSFSGIDEDLTAGVPLRVTVNAVEPGGEIYTDFSGEVKLRQITSYGYGRIEPEEIDLEDGEWSGNITLYLADVSTGQDGRGNSFLMAMLPDNSGLRGTSPTFRVYPGNYSRLQIILPGQVPVPGTPSGISGSIATQVAGCAFPVVIRATDQYWNPLEPASSPAIRVGLESSDPAAAITSPYSLEGPADTFSLSLGSAGIHTLTAEDYDDSSILPVTSEGIKVIGIEPNFVIDDLPSPVTAGDSVEVSVRVVDNHGHLIPEYNGQAILAASTGPGSFGPEHILFSGGTWTGNMVFRRAVDLVTVSCFDYSSPPNTGTSKAFRVKAAAMAGFQILLPGESPRGGLDPPAEGSPVEQTAGAVFPVTVRAVDRFWNRVPGVDDSIKVECDNGYYQIPEEIAMGDGYVRVPVTLFTSGMHRLSVSDVSSREVNSHLSSRLKVVPGEYSNIILLLPGQQLQPGSERGLKGTPLDQSVGYLFTVRAVATDSWWNPVNGISDLVAFSSTDTLAEFPPPAPLEDGSSEMEIRLGSGGYQQIILSNLTSPGIPEYMNQVRMINNGFHIEAEVTPEVVRAGEPFVLEARVTNDAGAVMQEVNSTASVLARNSFTAREGRGILLAGKIQFKRGRCRVRQTYTHAEPIILEIKSDYSDEPGVTNTLVVNPGPPDGIDLTTPDWVGGRRKARIVAKISDQFDNGIAARPVSFQLVKGGGRILESDTLTDDTGLAGAVFLSPEDPETGIIRAVSDSFSVDAEIRTALVDPALPGGIITSYPNPFHPDEGSTTIAYKLDADSEVLVRIFTLAGRLVLEKTFPPGRAGGAEGMNQISWDGRNGEGRIVSSGGYIAMLRAVRSGETIHSMRRRIAVVR